MLAAAGAGITFAAIPSIGLQVALVIGLSASTLSLLMARAGRQLDPAWVIVSLLYLVSPIGGIVRQAGLGISTVALVVLAPAPFVLMTLFARSDSRAQLIRLTPFALLVLYAGLSLAWTPSPGPGVEKLFVVILTSFVPAAFVLVLVTGPDRVSWWLIAVVSLLSALALIVLGEYSPLYPDRLSVFGDNPIWTGRAAFLGALVLMFGPFRWVVRAVGIPVLVAAGLLTVSLGPAIGLAMGVLAGVVVALFRASRANRRVFPAAVGLGLLCGFGLIFVLGDAFSGSGSIFSKVFVSDPNVAGRATFLGASVQLFLQAPLQGIGIGGFAATGLSAYPHNMVVEIAAELGVLGLLAYALWLGLALRAALRSPLLTALLVATTFYSLFSGSLASNVEFWLVSALAIAMVPISRRSSQSSPLERSTHETGLDAAAPAS